MRHSKLGLLIGAAASLAVAVPASAQLLGGGGLGGMTGGLGGSLGGSLGGTGAVGGTVDGVGRSVSGAVSGGGNASGKATANKSGNGRKGADNTERAGRDTSEIQALKRKSYAL